MPKTAAVACAAMAASLAMAIAVAGDATAQTTNEALFAKLFPYSFKTSDDALRGCESLLDVDNITSASRGAVVYMTINGRRAIIPHKGVAGVMKLIRDPRDDAYDATGVVEDRGSDMISILTKRMSPVYQGSVRCWFRHSAGVFRMISLDIDIPPPPSRETAPTR